MMVDANIIITALLKDSTVRKLLFFSGMEFATVDFAIKEINDHKGELMARTGLDERRFDRALHLILSKIGVFDGRFIAQELAEAKAIMETIDKDDAAYLALAMALEDAVIWSDDRPLKAQHRIRTFTTGEIISLLDESPSE